MRFKVRKTTRAAIHARDFWRCVYCKSTPEDPVLDHVIPRSKGGSNLYTNLVTACPKCNGRKSCKDLKVMDKEARRRARRALKRPLNRQLGRYISRSITLRF